MTKENPRTQWPALYLDGQTALARRVTVRILPQGLRITSGDRAAEDWLFSRFSLTQGEAAGEHARLESRTEDGLPALEVAEPGFVDALRDIAPDAGFRAQARAPERILRLAGAVVAVTGLLAAAYFRGIPLVADVATQKVPTAWEEKLGATMAAELAPGNNRITDSRQLTALQDIIKRLAATYPSPYTYRVAIARNTDVNAFAAPGGYIVVYQGLLQRTRCPEAMAGILAHEMQHVLHRHTTRGLLRAASLQVLLAAVVGDTGQVGQAVGLANNLGSLSYEREDEAEADRDGLAMLQAAHIDPAGMVEVFEMLRQQDGSTPHIPGFMSDHPDTAERVETIRHLAGQRKLTYVSLMAPARWQALFASGK